jgi:hypothetical protein
MNNTHSMSRQPKPCIPPPPADVAKLDLRQLLEANLQALHAILEEHRRTLDTNLRAVMGLRAELRDLADARAPWVKALAETRALLYVALREIITTNEAGDTAAWTRLSEIEL